MDIWILCHITLKWRHFRRRSLSHTETSSWPYIVPSDMSDITPVRQLYTGYPFHHKSIQQMNRRPENIAGRWEDLYGPKFFFIH